MIAAYHLKIKEIKKNAPLIPTPQAAPVKTESLKNVTEEVSNSYFFPDLLKSLILVAIVIALEIALYFARIIK